MSESQFTVTPGEELTSTSSPQVLTPKSNGSVITMTLKNNHLIVETEETSVSVYYVLIIILSLALSPRRPFITV